MSKYFKNNFLYGAEIGVAKGKHALTLLKTLSIKNLKLVDPYDTYMNDDEKVIFPPENYKIAKKRLLTYEHKGIITFIKDTSFNAIKKVDDNSLDFVYIDAAHDYKNVKQDISIWFPKVKTGGVLGGHDMSANYIGLCRAVIEFVYENNLPINGKNLDWWVIKKTPKEQIKQ
jgi:hypothetical protein